MDYAYVYYTATYFIFIWIIQIVNELLYIYHSHSFFSFYQFFVEVLTTRLMYNLTKSQLNNRVPSGMAPRCSCINIQMLDPLDAPQP
jgi:hypothetical protein